MYLKGYIFKSFHQFLWISSLEITSLRKLFFGILQSLMSTEFILLFEKKRFNSQNIWIVLLLGNPQTLKTAISLLRLLHIWRFARVEQWFLLIVLGKNMTLKTRTSFEISLPRKRIKTLDFHMTTVFKKWYFKVYFIQKFVIFLRKTFVFSITNIFCLPIIQAFNKNSKRNTSDRNLSIVKTTGLFDDFDEKTM